MNIRPARIIKMIGERGTAFFRRKPLVPPPSPPYFHQFAIFTSSDVRFIGNRCSTLAPSPCVSIVVDIQ